MAELQEDKGRRQPARRRKGLHQGATYLPEGSPKGMHLRQHHRKDT